jgi:hypothetical protein
MIRRIHQFYPAPVKITQHRGQFADLGHQQLLKPATKGRPDRAASFMQE